MRKRGKCSCRAAEDARTSAAEHDADQETEAKGNAERGNRVLPHGILDRFERLPRGILHSLELMVASALDLSGQGLKIPAQIGKVVGDLLNIVAERSLSRHFGVFRGHFILLSDNVPDDSAHPGRARRSRRLYLNAARVEATSTAKLHQRSANSNTNDRL